MFSLDALVSFAGLIIIIGLLVGTQFDLKEMNEKKLADLENQISSKYCSFFFSQTKSNIFGFSGETEKACNIAKDSEFALLTGLGKTMHYRD